MSTRHATNPFEHWIIDDFLPGEDAWAAYQHFYDGDGPWIRREHLYCHAKETRSAGLHPEVKRVLARLEHGGIRHYLGGLSGLPGLLSDRDRFGGGQHVIRRGGFLGIHADFTHHPTTGQRRVLNLLLYLNANWKKGDGGELELWAPNMSRCVRKVEPIFNRAVVFKTSPTSFHGHPEPLAGEEQRSLAVYYYQIVREGDHRLGYLRTTDYRPRPWEYRLRLRRWLSRTLTG